MVLNNCTVCSVYELDETVQRRLRVKCDGEQITLYMRRENELSDSERVRIDFFDGQIGWQSGGTTTRKSQNHGLQTAGYSR